MTHVPSLAMRADEIMDRPIIGLDDYPYFSIIAICIFAHKIN